MKTKTKARKREEEVGGKQDNTQLEEICVEVLKSDAHQKPEASPQLKPDAEGGRFFFPSSRRRPNRIRDMRTGAFPF